MGNIRHNNRKPKINNNTSHKGVLGKRGVMVRSHLDLVSPKWAKNLYQSNKEDKRHSDLLSFLLRIK
jgi:hypothetical protein